MKWSTGHNAIFVFNDHYIECAAAQSESVGQGICRHDRHEKDAVSR